MAWYRGVMLGLLLMSVLLLGARVALYPDLMQQPGALIYLLEPLVLLVCYGVLVLLLTRGNQSEQRQALAVGTIVGLMSALLWLINLTLEVFTTAGDTWGILATAPFLLGGFLLWGVAGLVGAWQTKRLLFGIVAAVWSAMLCALLTVMYGWVLLFAALPQLAAATPANPDFVRSHWTDVTAFTIANSFDAGFSHLLGALVIGGIVGSIGAGVGIALRRMQSARHVSAGERISA